MRLLKMILILLVLALGALALMPSPIDAAAWTPPAAPVLSGTTAPNALLKKADLLGLGQLVGPEDVDADLQGRVYGSLADGRIVRLLPDGSMSTFADTHGRPLGMEFDAYGNLIVADGLKGLLSISPKGTIGVLARTANGVPFGFTDDVDVARDGRIYFSDASSRFKGEDGVMFDLLEARPHGRLLRYDPVKNQVEVLLDGLYFANGVAVAPDDSFVLVNETFRYRITRYWLTGDKAGQSDIFADNLPGFPDGVASDGLGHFWVALVAPRNADADRMHPYPWVKNLVAKLPAALRPRPQSYGLVLALDSNGKIITSLHDPDGTHLNEITSVEPNAGMLYFGSLRNDRIGRLPITQVPGFETAPPSAAAPAP